MVKERPPLNGDILVEDLVEHYPELIGPLTHRGVVCMVCGEAYWGTLGELARTRGVEDLDGLLKEIKELL